MVSAPETNPTSRHARPASARAARAAVNPYSTKLRPHFPQGCMPTPRTATFLSSAICFSRVFPGRDRAPFPDDVLVIVVLVEDVGDQFDLGADREFVDTHARDHLTHHHHLLGRQFDGGDAEGLVGIGGPVGQRRLVTGVGVGPDPAPPAQGNLVELLAVALWITAELGLAG